MAYLGQTYNVADLPKGQDPEPVPAGMYNANITQAELKQTNAGGTMIKLRFDITGPTHQGRVVFGNINIRNANPKAEEIGMQQLGDLARAIGLQQVQDTDQLIGGHLQIKVAIRPAQGEYGPQNEVKGFKAVEGASATLASTFSPPPPPAATGGASNPPWKR